MDTSTIDGPEPNEACKQLFTAFLEQKGEVNRVCCESQPLSSFLDGKQTATFISLVQHRNQRQKIDQSSKLFKVHLHHAVGNTI